MHKYKESPPNAATIATDHLVVHYRSSCFSQWNQRLGSKALGWCIRWLFSFDGDCQKLFQFYLGRTSLLKSQNIKKKPWSRIVWNIGHEHDINCRNEGCRICSLRTSQTRQTIRSLPRSVWRCCKCNLK